jgi:hypothetical protein
MILNEDTIKGLELESGDIMGVKGAGPVSWACRNLIEPPTDLIHFALIWMPVHEGGDRVILESQGEGTWIETVLDILLHAVFRRGAVGQAVAIGRLSMYHGKEVRFFRPAGLLKQTRRRAPATLSAYGRDSYGYDYISKLVVRALWKWLCITIKERRFRRLWVGEMPPVPPQKALICTMAPDVGYQLVGADLIPFGMTSTPNVYEWLLQQGALVELNK